MIFGSPTKMDLARKLAAALSFTALVGYDRVEVAGCGGASLRYASPASGEVGAARLWQFVAGLQADGRGDFTRQVVEAAGRLREPGLTIVISDGLFDGGLVPALKALRAANHELAVVHLLDREELEPSVEGDWRLTDGEDPERQVEVTLTPVTGGDYRDRIAAYCRDLKEFCRKQGGSYFLVPGDTPVEDAVFGMMRGSLIG
jgi:uncharacterized protein (DUF58 family)